MAKHFDGVDDSRGTRKSYLFRRYGITAGLLTGLIYGGYIALRATGTDPFNGVGRFFGAFTSNAPDLYLGINPGAIGTIVMEFTPYLIGGGLVLMLVGVLFRRSFADKIREEPNTFVEPQEGIIGMGHNGGPPLN